MHMIQYGSYRDLRTGLNCVEKYLRRTLSLTCARGREMAGLARLKVGYSRVAMDS